MHIWLNIIDNAIKYSNDSVDIKINIIETGSYIEVVIKDNGIGIAKQDIERIFDKFYQIDSSHSSKGSGLGLSIVKQILEIIDGQIEYTSRINQGTTIRIVLRK